MDLSASPSWKLGPIIPTYEYYEAGYTKRQLAMAVTRGEILRVRQGWYCSPAIHPDVLAAARVGGRLTGLSLAASLTFQGANGRETSLWVPPHSRLHVAVPRTASRLRTRNDYKRRLSQRPDRSLCLHWEKWPAPDRRCIASPEEMLTALAVCETDEVATIVADSALNTGLLSHSDYDQFVAALPTNLGRSFSQVDGRSESGIETIARLRCRQFGLRMRPQMKIDPYRGDLLLGEKLLIELEGFEHHHTHEEFDADHARAAVLSAMGYRILPFSYRQVMFDWPQVEASIRAAIARGDHL